MKLIGHNLFDKLRIIDDNTLPKENRTISVGPFIHIWGNLRMPLSSRISNVRRATNINRI